METRRSSRARSIRLTVQKEQSRVILTLPRLISLDQGKQFLKSKQGWVENQWKKAQEQASKKKLRRYELGESFYYLGEEITLALCPHSSPACRHRICSVQGSELLLCFGSKLQEEQIKMLVERFYRQKASEIIHDRLEHFNTHYGLAYQKVSFRNQKTRWGSCSPQGNLNFNWRLVLAPIEVLDYVVVHELCHLIHMNHSAQFWSVVAQTLPDHPSRRKWLKENAFLLNL